MSNAPSATLLLASMSILDCKLVQHLYFRQLVLGPEKIQNKLRKQGELIPGLSLILLASEHDRIQQLNDLCQQVLFWPSNDFT